MMIDHFDMARAVARLIDVSNSPDEMVAALPELIRKFPTATHADWKRAMSIGDERLEILKEESDAAARNIADQVFGGAPDEVIEASIRQSEALFPSADTMFPQPDKSKS